MARAILKLSTEDISIITRFLAGHNALNKHLHFFIEQTTPQNPSASTAPRRQNPLNSGDYPEETASHIVEECPAFATLRMEYFKLDYYTTIYDILNRKNISVHKSLKDIAEFLKKPGCMSRLTKLSKPISPNRIIKQRKRTKTIKKQPIVQANKITHYLNPVLQH